MDFFRSILADDPEPESPDIYSQSDPNPIQNHSPNHPETEADEEDEDSTSNLNSSDDGSGGASSGGGGVAGGGLWSLGDLVKTLTTKSESVFETYRRDLQEFGTGLRKESDLFREVASRAVKELPASIDVGTSAIDGVLKSTAEIIAQGKEVLLASSDVDESDSSDRYNSERSGVDLNNSVRYSRFDAQLNAIRSDVRVFVEDPEDVEDYSKWKLGFVVGDKNDEIEELVGENGGLEEVYARLVPNEVDDGTFWFRYFYKVYKLKQQEEMRAKLVKRSLSVDDEEELSWDVDEDEDEEEEQVQHHKVEQADSEDGRKKQSTDDKIETQSSKIVDEDKEMITSVVSVDKSNAEEPKHVGEVKTHVEEAESVPKSEKVDLKLDSGESEKTKDSNVTVKSSEPSFHEDEDLEWDEIEDLGKTDDKNVIHGDTTTNKDDLRKRLSTAADEDEDLSWDIEDDDEPVKSGK